MREELYENSREYLNRWVISYADFVTILFALFIVMWSLTGGINAMKSMDKVIIKQDITIENLIKKEKNITQQALEEEPIINTEIQKPVGDSLIDKLIQLYPDIKEDFTIIKDKRGIILRSENTIFFDEGSAELNQNGINILNTFATNLKTLENPMIIEGHTDSTPIHTTKYPSNWELSTARATNIVKYLINNCGYAPNRLSAVGYGEFAPIVDNSNVKNKAKNRRVDIIILENNNHMEN